MDRLFLSISLALGISTLIYATIKKDDKDKVTSLISIIVTLVGIIAVMFLDKL